MTSQPNLEDIDQRLQSLQDDFAEYRSGSQQSIQGLQSLTAELVEIF